jgi:hypothetical protein
MEHEEASQMLHSVSRLRRAQVTWQPHNQATRLAGHVQETDGDSAYMQTPVSCGVTGVTPETLVGNPESGWQNDR